MLWTLRVGLIRCEACVGWGGGVGGEMCLLILLPPFSPLIGFIVHCFMMRWIDQFDSDLDTDKDVIDK